LHGDPAYRDLTIFDPVCTTQSATLDLIDLDENEAAFSLAVVNFSSRGGEPILVVGTAKDTLLSPRSCSSGYLRTYTILEDGKKLELLHIVSRVSSLLCPS
jgi:splicing factor 3B subunit 3